MSSGSWCAIQTCSTEPRMMRLTRTCVSLRSWSSVPRPAAKEARSSTTMSICDIADRIPSSIPIPSSCSSSSREPKRVVVTTLEPVPDPENSNRIVMDGMSVLGVPSSEAKPSRTSNELPSSTAVNSQYPADRSPSGPVMA
jgi:hypothetical protein